MTTIDYLTLAAYAALNIDVIAQTVHIFRRKSSLDISIYGVILRFVAITIIWLKLNQLGDISVLIGHSFVLITFTAYIIAIIYFRIKPNKK